MDIGNAIGRRYADGTVDKSWGNSYLEWTAGYAPYIDITIHDRHVPEQANTFEIQWAGSSGYHTGDGHTGVGTTFVMFRFKVDYPGNVTYVPPRRPSLEDGQDIVIWHVVDGAPVYVTGVTAGWYNSNGYKDTTPTLTLLAATEYHVRVDTWNWDCDGYKQVTTGPEWTFTTA
jgi:hypothetical protein